jgi:hypothetical protein
LKKNEEFWMFRSSSVVAALFLVGCSNAETEPSQAQSESAPQSAASTPSVESSKAPPPAPTPVAVAPNASAWIGKGSDEAIRGATILDAPDLKRAILNLPNGSQLLSEGLFSYGPGGGGGVSRYDNNGIVIEYSWRGQHTLVEFYPEWGDVYICSSGMGDGGAETVTHSRFGSEVLDGSSGCNPGMFVYGE